jgi:phage tail sheath protein FI
MAFQVSPGVNVSEIDLTTVVPAVSTTVGAVAGNFRWGPANQPILIDSEDRLVSIFNTPEDDTATDFFTASNFLAYGNALHVVRANVDGRNATAGGSNTTITVANSDEYDTQASTGSLPADHGDWIARHVGVLGNSLKISVCQSDTAWSSSVTTGYTLAIGTKALVLANAATSSSFSVGDNLVLGAEKLTGKIAAIAGQNITLAEDYVGTTVANTDFTTINRSWEHAGITTAAPGTSDYAAKYGSSGDGIHVVVTDEDGLITGTKGSVLEVYNQLSVAKDAKTNEGSSNFYKDVINQNSSWVWWANHNANLGSAGSRADATVTFTGAALPVSTSFLAGSDTNALTSGALITAYNKFSSATDIDISLVLASGHDVTTVKHIINNIVDVRKDCVAVLSPEKADCVNNGSYAGKEAEDVIAYRDTLPSSSYAVMDSSWKYQYDKFNDVYRWVPLNGDTAGLMVQTDLTRDPWFSPAGFNRGNVKNIIKLAYNPSKTDRDNLYKKGINPVVTFPGQGTVLFGDKTMLNQPSAFDRINVRRLFIVLEKAISTASKFTLFEFNDEFTRAQFKNLVEPFLRDVQGRKGITDFAVVCDGTNNTGEIIDRNEFVGDIYVKPSRSINFIQLNFVAVRTGVEFTEIVGRA